MNAPQISMTRLLRDLDDLKIAVQPFPPHFAVECDTHIRENYACLLATILLTQTSIGEPQSRLFKMLLASLGLGDIQARLFEQAQKTDKNSLNECARIFKENNLAQSFLMDAAVLLRLAAPLTATQQQLLAELTDLFGIAEADLARVAELAAMALGMPSQMVFPSGVDFSVFRVWDEFMYRELNAEMLAQGISGGLWRVSTPIAIQKSWSLKNCILVFASGGAIRTHADGEIETLIENCTLFQPIIEFAGAVSTTFNNMNVSGDYPVDQKVSVITQNENRGAIFENCKFATNNARTLWLTMTPTNITDCLFVGCGHRDLIGGAIAARTSKTIHLTNGWTTGITHNIHTKITKLKILNSTFADCISRLGGAIRANVLNDSIVDTKFKNCRSVEAYCHTAIFVDHTILPFIKNSLFDENDIRIGYCGRAENYVISNSTFKGSSSIYYYHRPSNYTIAHGCTFDRGCSRESHYTLNDWFDSY